jgi:hypothetical protein
MSPELTYFRRSASTLMNAGCRSLSQCLHYDRRVSPNAGRYVVLQQVGDRDWQLLGEVDRQPGVPARRSRGQAVRDMLGREPEEGETFAVLPRSEWQLSIDH